jgi:hypothetical protein
MKVLRALILAAAVMLMGTSDSPARALQPTAPRLRARPPFPAHSPDIPPLQLNSPRATSP